MDSRAQRANWDYRDRGVSQENQAPLDEMARWEILEIQDQGETLGHLDQRVTEEGKVSAILDQGDRLETGVHQVGEDPQGAEVTVAPKENPEIKGLQERLVNQASQGRQEKEGLEGNVDLMGIQDQQAILGSLNVMS